MDLLAGIFLAILACLTIIRDFALWMFEAITGWFLGGHIDMKMAATIAAGIALYKALDALGKWPNVFMGKDIAIRHVTPRMLEAYGKLADEWHGKSVDLAERQISLLEDLVEELRSMQRPKEEYRNSANYLGDVYLGDMDGNR
jgi:hypothetical protein